MDKHREQLDFNTVNLIYSQTNSLSKTAKIIGCGKSKLQNFCAQNNIKHKMSYNHSVFSIKTSSSCYWAGFIAADGCIYKNFLKVVLQKKDNDHLNNLFKFLNSVNQPKIKNNYSSLSIRSKQITSDLLKNFNIIPKKSLVLKPPILENEEQEKNFIRGYSDGDGCLYISKSKDIFSFSIISGSPDMIEWIKNIISKYTNIFTKISFRYYKKSTYYIITYSGNTACSVLTWLYRDSDETTRLKRKYEKFLQIIITQKFKNKNKEIKEQKLKEEIELMKKLYLDGLTYDQIAIKMNIKSSKVFYHLSKDKSIKKIKGFARKQY